MYIKMLPKVFIIKLLENETENGSVENALSMRRTVSNETVFISEIPYIINDENV